MFHDWVVRKIQDLRQEYPGDDGKVMSSLRELYKRMTPEGEQYTLWDKVVGASGGTSAGVLKLVQDEDPYYQKLAAALALPLPTFITQEKGLEAELQNASNPLVSLLPTLLKARHREARIQVTLAMVHAAIEYKLRGPAGLQGVRDPAGLGPFGYQRFVFQGVDRGFQLKSVYDAGGFPETLIFVEKTGPDFLVGGPHVGQARGK